MKKIFVLLLSIFVGAIQFSCSSDSKNPNPLANELQNGAFVRFIQGTPKIPGAYSLTDPSAVGFSYQVEDPNDNVTSYKLKLTASVSGSQYVVDFVEFTSFPNTLTVNLDTLASALGLNASDFNFGDTFDFTSVVTRNDGTLFYGIQPDFNATNLTVGLGNTEGNLSTLPSYRSAMNFGFALACPLFTAQDLVGTWNVTALAFTTTFQETQTTREIIAGPGDNQITIVGGEYPTGGGEHDDLILTFNGATGLVSAVNTDGVAFGPGNVAGLDTNTYLLEEGLILPCINQINLTMNFNPFSGNPHPFNLSR